MDFLREAFGDEALRYEQLAERLEESGVKPANLAGGAYVGAEKHRALAERLEQMQARLDEQEQRHAAALRSAEFDALVQREIAAAGGRNGRAICALLDSETLAGSEQPQQALREALEQLKESEGYLFCAPAPPGPLAVGTGAAPMMPDAYKDALGMK